MAVAAGAGVAVAAAGTAGEAGALTAAGTAATAGAVKVSPSGPEVAPDGPCAWLLTKPEMWPSRAICCYHGAAVTGCAMSADGTRLATALSNQTMATWDTWAGRYTQCSAATCVCVCGAMCVGTW